MTEEEVSLEAGLLLVGRQLHGIRNELAAIREAITITPVDDADPYTCTRCGTVLSTAQAAKVHAINDHKAPQDAWRELYTAATEEP